MGNPKSDDAGLPVETARAALGAGVPAVDVFAELALKAADLQSAALAVCLALGVPRADAEQRLDGSDELLDELNPGEERTGGEILETLGVFDVDRSLDERGEEIKRWLGTAIGAHGTFGSGHAHSLWRRLRTGALTGAFLSLADSGPHPVEGAPSTYWEALTRAGELLSADNREVDERFEKALERCRRQAAGTGRGCPGTGGR
ncbi:hypothetical protein [Streptomyces chattanoogensis]|uniref:hypothetical protein n=1 Tax=Streptomyces chattanoogensis TaxID=66876 RepID=UPI0036CD340C